MGDGLNATFNMFFGAILGTLDWKMILVHEKILLVDFFFDS